MQRTDGDRRTGYRLLPWTTEDGKRCVLSTDNEGGFVSRLADDFEAGRLAAGADVLAEASTVLANPLCTHAELRYATLLLTECLTDALRIAECRGLRVPMPYAEEDVDKSADDETGGRKPMSRSVLRSITRTIRHEPMGGVAFEASCLATDCKELSDPVAEQETAQDWRLRHADRTGHDIFRRLVTDRARVTQER